MNRGRLAKRRPKEAQETEYLFELPKPTPPEPLVKPIHSPIWTENKAKLIERYLYYFVLVTKHGTYIDGFAGPQKPDKPEMWAAKLVLESEPRWFRNFHLFDSDKKQIERLQTLVDSQPNDPKRNIKVYPGNFNDKVSSLLNSRSIKQTEATFCLLDQRTFECHWSTLETLARHKTSGSKIELFYFLPNAWLDRAVTALKDTKRLQEWWGRDDCEKLRSLQASDRKELFVKRFKNELGYHSVKPWPIFERHNGGNIMYYMIHATDHKDAPKLMERAYRMAVQPKESPEQLALELGIVST